MSISVEPTEEERNALGLDGEIAEREPSLQAEDTMDSGTMLQILGDVQVVRWKRWLRSDTLTMYHFY